MLFIPRPANMLEQAPIAEPLRDRMEIIELQGYSEEEKTAHRSPIRQFRGRWKKTESRPSRSNFRTEALRYVIRHYTREAGVHSLERTISTIYANKRGGSPKARPKSSWSRRKLSRSFWAASRSALKVKLKNAPNGRGSQWAWRGLHQAATCCLWKPTR